MTKIQLLYITDTRKLYGFGITWGRVNDDKFVIFFYFLRDDSLIQHAVPFISLRSVIFFKKMFLKKPHMFTKAAITWFKNTVKH